MPRMSKLSHYKTLWAVEGDVGSVMYVETLIAAWNEHGIRLDSGKWRTVTTKRKMNQASNQFGLGYQVFQRKGEWFVTWKGQELPFHDGMILTR